MNFTIQHAVKKPKSNLGSWPSNSGLTAGLAFWNYQQGVATTMHAWPGLKKGNEKENKESNYIISLYVELKATFQPCTKIKHAACLVGKSAFVWEHYPEVSNCPGLVDESGQGMTSIPSIPSETSGPRYQSSRSPPETLGSWVLTMTSPSPWFTALSITRLPDLPAKGFPFEWSWRFSTKIAQNLGMFPQKGGKYQRWIFSIYFSAEEQWNNDAGRCVKVPPLRSAITLPTKVGDHIPIVA